MQDDTSKIKIQDELSYIQINQLHKATMTFSSQSFELKKFSIVAISTVSTIILGAKRDGIILGAKKDWYVLFLAIVLITVLFYTLDAIAYYYQRVLRQRMIDEENKIYNRNNITEIRLSLSKQPTWWGAFFNKSHFMYYTIVVICVLILVFIKGINNE